MELLVLVLVLLLSFVVDSTIKGRLLFIVRFRPGTDICQEHKSLAVLVVAEMPCMGHPSADNEGLLQLDTDIVSTEILLQNRRELFTKHLPLTGIFNKLDVKKAPINRLLHQQRTRRLFLIHALHFCTYRVKVLMGRMPLRPSIISAITSISRSRSIAISEPISRKIFEDPNKGRPSNII
ncbi:hypothetical protein GQX74_006050 [Glossina fuscipes]|nr:hypothetical protein GQX74_006050 [Glossina fuscipes]